ncbi:MAG: DUF6064 family protein [Rubrivivax sp.]|nr:DUF6064 family protein [Rubrivivax sp.]
MSEWWTYRPSDFLMFAPRTYWRLFELHNEAWWPAQPLLVLAGLGWLWWGPRHGSAALRATAAGLAAAWAFVALAFLLPRYAPIHWAASGFAIVFLAQALGLAALATRADLHAAPPGPRRRIAALLCGWALLGHPLLAPALGRPWLQGEFFGLAPDPTAIATLGFLLWAGSVGRVTRWLLRLLWTLATAWCVVSTATLWTMGSAQGWAVLAAALVALVAACARGGRLLRP